jgi:hypothetical protein
MKEYWVAAVGSRSLLTTDEILVGFRFLEMNVSHHKW